MVSGLTTSILRPPLRSNLLSVLCGKLLHAVFSLELWFVPSNQIFYRHFASYGSGWVIIKEANVNDEHAEVNYQQISCMTFYLVKLTSCNYILSM